MISIKKKHVGYIVIAVLVLSYLARTGGNDDELTIDTVQSTNTASFDTGTLDGFYSHITSTKFKRTCSADENYTLIEFRNDDTFSNSIYNKRSEQLTDSTSGRFKIGEVKFVDAEEGTFRYIRLSEEDWRVLTVNNDYYDFDGKELVELTTNILGIEGLPKFDGYDELGPIVFSSNIKFATDCETFVPIN